MCKSYVILYVNYMKVDMKTVSSAQIAITHHELAQLEQTLKTEVLKLIEVLRDNNAVVGFAESCTGGLVSSLITELSGVSEFFWGSVVSYSNEAKQLFLGVESQTFQQQGAVSALCAQQMSEGVLRNMKSTTFANNKTPIAVSITGIAGPSGGSAQKPVGTVFMGVSIGTNGTSSSSQIYHHHFHKDVSAQEAQASNFESVSNSDSKTELSRTQIQKLSALYALKHLQTELKQQANKKVKS